MSYPLLRPHQPSSSSSSSFLSFFSGTDGGHSSSSQTDASPPDSPSLKDPASLSRLASSLDVDQSTTTPRLQPASHPNSNDLEYGDGGYESEREPLADAEVDTTAAVAILKARPRVLKKKRGTAAVRTDEEAMDLEATPFNRLQKSPVTPRKGTLADGAMSPTCPPKPQLLPIPGTDSPSPIFPLPTALIGSTTRFSSSTTSTLSPKSTAVPFSPFPSSLAADTAIPSSLSATLDLTHPLPSPWSPMVFKPTRKQPTLGLGLGKSVKTSPGITSPVPHFRPYDLDSSLDDRRSPKRHSRSSLNGLGLDLASLCLPDPVSDLSVALDDVSISSSPSSSTQASFSPLSSDVTEKAPGRARARAASHNKVPRRPLRRRLSDISELFGSVFVSPGKSPVASSKRTAALCASTSWTTGMVA